MARAFQFQQLLELSQERSDKASQVMSACRAEWQQTELKLQQLEAFRAEYRERLLQHEQRGIGVQQWRDQQQFILKLDLAIQHQHGDVERARGQFEAAKAAWMDVEKQVNAYKTLAERHHAHQAKREAKAEQKALDEFAGRSAGSRGDADGG